MSGSQRARSERSASPNLEGGAVGTPNASTAGSSDSRGSSRSVSASRPLVDPPANAPQNGHRTGDGQRVHETAYQRTKAVCRGAKLPPPHTWPDDNGSTVEDLREALHHATHFIVASTPMQGTPTQRSRYVLYNRIHSGIESNEAWIRDLSLSALGRRLCNAVDVVKIVGDEKGVWETSDS